MSLVLLLVLVLLLAGGGYGWHANRYAEYPYVAPGLGVFGVLVLLGVVWLLLGR